MSTRPCVEQIKMIEYKKLGNRSTICLLTLKSGWEVIGTSACVDPETYDTTVGNHWAYEDALNKLEQLETYYKHEKDYSCGE